MRHTLDKILRAIHLAESGLLTALLVATIGLSMGDVVLRNLFNSGIPNGAQIVRILVLWLGLMGALYATRHSKHITVDILARLLKPKIQRLVKAITALFAAFICGVIAWHSAKFVYDSYTYGDTLFAQFPAWVAQIVIPSSFALIALRFALHALSWLTVECYSGNSQNSGQQNSSSQ